MPLDRSVQRFVAAMAAGSTATAAAQTLESRRRQLVDLMRFSGPKIPLAHCEELNIRTVIRTIPVRLYSPRPASIGNMSGLIYFHGGGLVAGSLDTHDNIARALSHFGQCRIISVDYRLAPEHPFPAALEDAIAAVRYAREHAADFGIAPSKLGVCGDSAGAALAAAACQALRGVDVQLAVQLLICPILDFSRVTHFPSRAREGYVIDEATVSYDLMLYLPPGVDAADPRVSPLRAPDLRGLPPTIIHTAEFDPMRESGDAYYNRMRTAGSPVECHCHAGMIHLFYGLGTVIPYAQMAYQQMGEQIRHALS